MKSAAPLRWNPEPAAAVERIAPNGARLAQRRTAVTLLVATLLFAAALPAFDQQTFGTRISDIPEQFLLVRSGLYPVYSILYVLVGALSWSGADATVIGWTAVILLSACVALKGALTFQVLSETSERLFLPAASAFALAFAMPIMNWWNPQSVYLGQIAPTIWHNATTILAMPAVIVLFYAGLKCLDDPTSRNVRLTAGLCALSAVIKPNYALAWLPVFLPWFCINAFARRVPLRRLAGQVAILVAPTMILLLVQGLAVASYLGSKVIVAPFGVWMLYSPHPLASLLLSLAFPLAVLAFYRKPLLRGSGPILAWLIFAVAMLQLVLLAEDGARFSHGNFFWGAYMAIYLLFLTSADVIIRRPTTPRSLFVLAILALHVASGAYFYWRIVSGLGYL